MCARGERVAMEIATLPPGAFDGLQPPPVTPEIADGTQWPTRPPLEPEEECPNDPLSAVAPCVDGTRCEYGKECCCGNCYASMEAECSQGEWMVMMTEACMHPSCGTGMCTGCAQHLCGSTSLVVAQRSSVSSLFVSKTSSVF